MDKFAVTCKAHSGYSRCMGNTRTTKDTAAGSDVQDHGPFSSTAPTWQEDRYNAGVAARQTLPPESLATYTPNPKRDPLGILAQQNQSRVPDLVPLRMTRMLQDRFAFFRGAAALMAADMYYEPISGGRVFVCGDAHINNFGVYATPEGRLVFDVNDFDESTIGPWEWDIKRTVTSVVLASQLRGDDKKIAEQDALECVRAYRDSLQVHMERYVQDRFFRPTKAQKKERPGPKTPQERVGIALSNTIKTAKKRTSLRAAEKMTQPTSDGRRVIVPAPPVLVPLVKEDYQYVQPAFEAYIAQMPSNVQLLMSEFKLTDMARRVVGVGSVGTRCYVGVYTGPDGEPFVLQLKQAVLSALVQYGKQAIPDNPILVPERTVETPGYRVATCQRALQEVSDPFLGDIQIDGYGFYVRQFRDESAGVDVTTLKPKEYTDYVRACGAQLGRAHIRSQDGAFAAGYMGKDDEATNALASWGAAYAEQSVQDWEALKAATAAGKFPTMKTSE